MNKYFDCCLYFTANELARQMDKLADKAFEHMDITPIQGFTLLLIADKGLDSPRDLAIELGMNPSSITRFLDALVKKAYINRDRQGRSVTLVLTQEGQDIIGDINKCWDKIYEEYSVILGESQAIELNDSIVKATRRLKKDFK